MLAVVAVEEYSGKHEIHTTDNADDILKKETKAQLLTMLMKIFGLKYL
ncbi:MAG: hypothetical protein LBU10_04620 [Endomicrobium sp.]|nr:hypothetical protein [Endomicrobium sp.]